MSTVETLVRARALYAEAPSHVPEGEYPESGTYCVIYALGAAADIGGDNSQGFYMAVLDRMVDAAGEPDSMARWNAKHTTEEVLAAFDRAIATERERCRTRNDLDGIPVREPVRTLSEPVLA